MTDSDRRKAERLHLDPPLAGSIDDMQVAVLEAGLLGARVEHENPLLPNSTVTLSFEWEGESISITSRVVRSEIQPLLATPNATIFHSGLEFLESSSDASLVLRRLIAAHVTRRLERLKANARGDAAEPVTAEMIHDVPFLTGVSSIPGRAPVNSFFLSFRFSPTGEWICNRASKARQPLDGFTVPANLPEREIALLKDAYEKTSAEGRNLIRICAELSVTEGETVPPQRLVGK